MKLTYSGEHAKLTMGQVIALGSHVCNWPENKSFEEICNLIHEESEEIELWDDLRFWDSEELITHIIGLSKSIDKAIRDVKEGVL